MTNKNSHFKGERKQPKANPPHIFHTQKEYSKKERKNEAEGILQEFKRMDFNTSRKELEIQLMVIIDVYPEAWCNLNPRTKIGILRNELAFRYNLIEAKMAKEIKRLLAPMNSTSFEAYTEELWNKCWALVLQIAEQEGPFSVGNLPCIKYFPQCIGEINYTDWCETFYGQATLSEPKTYKEIEFELTSWKSIYPASFLNAWQMGKGNRDLAFQYLWSECARLDKQFGNKSTWDNY
ncbi:hypothetical protein NEIG_00639 [Nematocida sp. ERTm5]|nr:hypothetical protein NEIG_00639 [Nematocida sp. ERTm5]